MSSLATTAATVAPPGNPTPEMSTILMRTPRAAIIISTTTSGNRQCSAPPSYGNYSQTTYTGTPMVPGQTITLSCKKGSAFNAAQLIQKGYATDVGGANVDISDRFRTITLTCDEITLTWLPIPADVPECQDFLECLRSTTGKEYFGTSYSKTETGTSCIDWGSVSSISDWSIVGLGDNPTGVVFPTNKKATQGAFCRNPGRDKVKPWCYVTTTTWEYCNIPRCLDPTVSTLECSLTSVGYDYLGVKGPTSGGTACQLWSNSPRTIDKGYLQNMPDDVYPHNYCRNPGRDNLVEPWCYTDITVVDGVYYHQYGTCGISPCPGFP